MLIWIAIFAWLLLVRLAVGAPTRPEQWLVRATARRRSSRLPVARQ